MAGENATDGARLKSTNYPHDTSIISSPFQVELPAIDVFSFIRPTFARLPSKIAIIEEATGRTLTFSDVDRRSALIARQLHDLGLRRGDRLALYSPNCAEYALVLLASFRLATAIVTINHLSTADELRHYVSLTDPKLLIAAAGACVDNALKATTDAPVKTILVIGKHPRMTSLVTSVDNSGTQQQQSNQLPVAEPEVTSHGDEIDPSRDVVLIQFSSGTTGLPKAVMFSHRNVLAVTLPLSRMESYAQDCDVRVIYQPMSHTFGFGLTCTALAAGMTLVILPRFTLHGYLSAVQKYRITDLAMVPPIAVQMAKCDLSSYDLSRVVRIISASAPLSRHVEAELAANKALSNPNLQIGQAYGLTETCGLISYSTNAVHHGDSNVTDNVSSNIVQLQPRGSSGQLFANTQIKVVDPASDRCLGADEDGEILARGPHVMLGYMNNPSATAATIDDQGWLHTGDIGHYDSDGYLFIVDRAKELIKYKGFQVAPAELEALILSHPDVADAGVIGIPDTESGELPRAWVVPKPQSASSLREKHVIDWVAAKVAPYKRLRGGVQFVKVIPRSPTGKILRKIMRSQSSVANFQSML